MNVVFDYEPDEDYLSIDEVKEATFSLAADCVIVGIFVAVFALILGFVADRSFLDSFGEERGVVSPLDWSEVPYLDMEVAESLAYYGQLIGDPVLAAEEESAVGGEDDPELFATEDFKQYKKALKKNSNTAGWISIGGLIVNYPVMWSKDNQYYLNHNASGKKDVYGAIFLDSGSGGEFQLVNIVHGHNMRDGKMFGELDKYKDEAFVKKHRYLSLTTSSGTRRYRVFSVIITDGEKEEVRTGFEDVNDFQKYLKKINRRSIIDLDFKDYPDSIVVLNTCTYEFSGAHLLVFAEEI